MNHHIGVFQYGKTTKHNSHVYNPDMIEVENALSKIVDDKLFFEVQSIVKARRNGKNSATIDYLLSGKLYCQCGSVMYGAKNGVRKSTGTHYYHYHCRKNIIKEANVPHQDCARNIWKQLFSKLLLKNFS